MADRSRARRVSVAPPSVSETVQAKGGRAGLADAVRKVTNIGASIEAMKARRTERLDEEDDDDDDAPPEAKTAPTTPAMQRRERKARRGSIFTQDAPTEGGESFVAKRSQSGPGVQDDLLKGVVAEDYLRKVQLVSEHFHGFDDDDVQTLARTMDVVTFKEGEQILQRGEPASWVGIVLEGDLDVPVAPQLTFHLHRGDFLGELSVFESGTRSADIVAGTDGVIGLLTFEALEAFLAENPPLGFKMLRAMGAAVAVAVEAVEARRRQARRRCRARGAAGDGGDGRPRPEARLDAALSAAARSGDAGSARAVRRRAAGRRRAGGVGVGAGAAADWRRRGGGGRRRLRHAPVREEGDGAARDAGGRLRAAQFDAEPPDGGDAEAGGGGGRAVRAV